MKSNSIMLCLTIGMLSFCMADKSFASDTANVSQQVNVVDFEEYAQEFAQQVAQELPNINVQEIRDELFNSYQYTPLERRQLPLECAFEDDDDNKAFGLLVDYVRKKADSGDAKMQVIFGYCIDWCNLDGIYEREDLINGEDYFWKAADQNDPYGSYAVARYSFDGCNFGSARNYYKKAAQFGHPKAAFEAKVMERIIRYVGGREIITTWPGKASALRDKAIELMKKEGEIN